MRFFLTPLLSLFAVAVVLAACSENSEERSERPETIDKSDIAPAALTMQRWSNSCALCHVKGEGGAPKTGDTEAWTSRMAKGQAVLLEHTVQGFNQMPPLGYCMSCETEDFMAMIEFMAGQKFEEVQRFGEAQ